MAEQSKPQPEIKSEVEKVQEQSSAQAIARVEKNLLIERQNLVGKRLLRLLPFQIFLLVADADGKTDTKEVAGFREFINQREKYCSNPYTRRMFHSTVVNYPALTNRYLSGSLKKDFKIVQNAIHYMQICVSSRLMADICKDLKQMAVAVAEASGGFMGMTSPISSEEEAVLKKLDKIFAKGIENAHGSDIIKPEQLDF